MKTPRISASSYSNTAPLVWSFLYGRNHGKVELILDNAPVRSAELLAENRVRAALVPVIAYQTIDKLLIVPEVCVGAKQRVRSVCLITDGRELADVRSVSLDTSSKTSAALTKIIFREFLGLESQWRDSAPDVSAMLAKSDAALVIGDPALRIEDLGSRMANFPDSAFGIPHSAFKTFDLAELWHKYTGLGFVFAMWMSRERDVGIDFAAARDEGLRHLAEISANYAGQTDLGQEAVMKYLTENISYDIDDTMQHGLELFYKLAAKHNLIAENRPLLFTNS